MKVINAIYQCGCHYHPFELQLQTGYTGHHMHIVTAGVHFDQLIISPSKLTEFEPACSQTVGLNIVNPMTYARTSKFRTFSFLLVELQVEYGIGQNHNYSPWFIIECGMMGCPASDRSMVMEMWSLLCQFNHRSIPFCCYQLQAI